MVIVVFWEKEGKVKKREKRKEKKEKRGLLYLTAYNKKTEQNPDVN